VIYKLIELNLRLYKRIHKQLNIIKMKKVLLTIAVLFTAASISLACGEEKKACSKGEKKACCKKDAKACASKDEKSCAKAKSCCKKKSTEATAAPAPVEVTPAK
jgi:hypothetical protein